MKMLKNDIQVIKQKDLYYIARSSNNIERFKPWLGDSFSFLYDFLMKSSIFPKKFGADMGKHFEILGQALKDIHGKQVDELQDVAEEFFKVVIDLIDKII